MKERPEEQPVTEAADAAAEAEESTQAQGDEAAEESTATAEQDALRERYLRLAAEFDNYRKRTERERGESWVRAQAQLIEKLLDSLDDLQRVAQFNAENTSVEALLEGVQMVERKLFRVLESAGLEPIQAEGQPFDPSVHEALMTTAAESEKEDDSVGQVFQSGYQFKDILLRPARVQVKKYEG